MKNQIVILAAGKGTRMGQSNVPKVLVMLKQKPLILHLLHELDKLPQLIKPVVVVGYGAEKVKGVLGNDYLYAYQDKQLGTAHALLAAKPKVKGENILVLNGDMPFIKAESLRELAAMHLHGGGNISLLTAETRNFSGRYASLESYGRILRDTFHNIIGIVEARDATDAQEKIKEVNPGIYMFNTKWLWANLKKIQNLNAQKEYYLTDIIDIAISQGQKVSSLLISPDEVLGINSRGDLEIAEKLL